MWKYLNAKKVKQAKSSQKGLRSFKFQVSGFEKQNALSSRDGNGILL
jgi:hypothetical protein